MISIIKVYTQIIQIDLVRFFMKMISTLSSIAFATLFSLTAFTAQAQTEPGQAPGQAPVQGQPNGARPHHFPPQEALDACNGKAEHDSCSFVGRQNENITGNCRKGPNDQGPLACAPLHPPGGAINGGGANPSGKPPM